MATVERALNGVKGERSEWRDQEISKRHREWGFNCPAVDLDFVAIEYNLGIPVALIEYKKFGANLPDFRSSTIQAMTRLANASKIPFLVVAYWPDVWAFRAHPVNEYAKEWFASPQEYLSERDFVKRLYDTQKPRGGEGSLRQPGHDEAAVDADVVTAEDAQRFAR